ncbi:MAG: alpha/beta hydrolase [Proteobacteria bacterium]|nr:alpha/beta hydrolase [Pseudomonadota bacterium]
MAFAKINNINLHYQLSGKENGAVMIFIHGLGSSGADWQKQSRFFAKNYRVLTVDLRGHGSSQRGDDKYSIALFAKDIIDLAKHLEIKSAHIIGISLGGAIALQLAVDAPQLVQSLVVVNAIAEFKLNGIEEKWAFFSRVMLVKLCSMKMISRLLSKKLFPKANQQQLRQSFIEKFSKNDKQAYYASLKSLFGWSVAQHIADIACPTLFICAQNDYSPTSRKQFYAEQMRDARVVEIKDSHHALPVEKAREFNDTLMQFIG